tara:strand:- start:763 stop:1206 length:444 start_codon:yes stop_codon:yes gene_type:complete
MKLIAHRGNTNGPNLKRENTQSYIDESIGKGYDVEIDVWVVKGELFLGHDEPISMVDLEWLLGRSKNLWIHCKNFNSLQFLLNYDQLKLFFHEEERYTIISNGLIWAHDLREVNDQCIIPLLSEEDLVSWNPTEVFGICSDYVDYLK